MPGEKKKRQLVCPICGSPLIKTPEGNYVCPVCGIVYGPVMVPGYQQLSHNAPVNSIIIKVPRFNPSKIMEKVKDELSDEDKENIMKMMMRVAKNNYILVADADVVREMLDSITGESTYDRVKRIESVKEAMVLLANEYSLPEEVVEEAFYNSLLYRRYWSGRTAEKIACVFLALTCELTNKCDNGAIASRCRADYNKIREIVFFVGGEGKDE